MSKVYIAMEAMGAVVILLLLYGNVFEIKQHTRKRDIFTRLLIENEVAVVADMVSWMHLDWAKRPAALGVLVTISYIIPLLAQATFSEYVYAHISERQQTRKTPFRVIYIWSVAAVVITLILCASGKLYEIRDGVWYSGVAEPYYFLGYVVTMLFFAGIIFANREKLGLHDLLATISFCVVPLTSTVLSFMGLGINLGVASMSIDALVIYIMLQSEQEGRLMYSSNNDELTGLLNRRAYEDFILMRPAVPPEPDFVYASIDINGLKQANDSLGHKAGDELIRGAAECLNQVFGNYGRVFRTGGDEFAAIFFADGEKLSFLREDLETVTGQWKGKLVPSLALSAGYAAKREFPEETVKELANISDMRMYEAKERYYSDCGLDRRGKKAAQSALCALYTKILQVNLTEDTYSIISMDASEQTAEKGFATSISDWLAGFGKTGYVHPEDLPEYLEKTDLQYLKDYFGAGKASLSIFYRRKGKDGFKQVAMEMIPAADYTPDHQVLFLLVKNIDL